VNVGDDGGLAGYSIDAASGALTAMPGSPFAIGGVPNSVAIDASGKFLMVSIFPLGGGSHLAVFSIDPGTGALTSVPGSPFGPAYSWGVLLPIPRYRTSTPGRPCKLRTIPPPSSCFRWIKRPVR